MNFITANKGLLMEAPAMKAFNTLVVDGQADIEIKKSKFIGYAFHADTVEAFDTKLAEIKKEHPQARHHCYAYRLNEQVLLEKYQDDKEPQGTAGLPILEVLKGQDLEEVGVVVVRYFGGTLLGTGGLSRAYSDAARDAIKASGPTHIDVMIRMVLTVDYSDAGKITYYAGQESIVVVDQQFDQAVHMTLAFEANRLDSVKEALNEMTQGKVRITKEEETIGYSHRGAFIQL